MPAANWKWILHHAQRIRASLFVASFLLMIIILLIRFFKFDLYCAISHEDGLFEYAQTACYFLCFILFISLGLARYRVYETLQSLVLFLFAMVCFLLSMEEISWGQRIFSLATPPALELLNRQHETNIHNLNPVHRGFQYLFIFAGCCFLMALAIRYIPYFKRAPWARTWFRKLLHLTPGWYLLPYPLPVMLIYSYYLLFAYYGYTYLGWSGFRIGVIIHWRDQEPAEFMLALGVLLYAISLWARLRFKQATSHHSFASTASTFQENERSSK